MRIHQHAQCALSPFLCVFVVYRNAAVQVHALDPYGVRGMDRYVEVLLSRSDLARAQQCVVPTQCAHSQSETHREKECYTYRSI
jgi:hypothetical protein